MRTKNMRLNAMAVASLGLAGLVLGTSSAGAATEVIMISIDPPTKQVCMQEVGVLQDKAKNVAGTALAVAHAQEASEACQAGKFDDAEEALVDGYKWLGRKKGRGQ